MAMNIRRKLNNELNMYNRLMRIIEYREHWINFNENESTDALITYLSSAVRFANERLETYFESGHTNNDMQDEVPDIWKSHVTLLRGFISAAKSTLQLCR